MCFFSVSVKRIVQHLVTWCTTWNRYMIEWSRSPLASTSWHQKLCSYLCCCMWSLLIPFCASHPLWLEKRKSFSRDICFIIPWGWSDRGHIVLGVSVHLFLCLLSMFICQLTFDCNIRFVEGTMHVLGMHVPQVKYFQTTLTFITLWHWPWSCDLRSFCRGTRVWHFADTSFYIPPYCSGYKFRNFPSVICNSSQWFDFSLRSDKP